MYLQHWYPSFEHENQLFWKKSWDRHERIHGSPKAHPTMQIQHPEKVQIDLQAQPCSQSLASRRQSERKCHFQQSCHASLTRTSNKNLVFKECRTLSCPMSIVTAQTSINQQLSRTRTSLMHIFYTLNTQSFTTSFVTQKTAVSTGDLRDKDKRRRASSTEITGLPVANTLQTKTTHFFHRRNRNNKLVSPTQSPHNFPGKCCNETSSPGGVP